MPLKILQMISSGGFFGAENVLLELSDELKKAGHSVTVGVIRNSRNPNTELSGKAAERSINTVEFECNGKFDLKTISTIGSYVREGSIDIVHSHGYKANIYAVLSNRKNRRPLVTTCHNWIVSSARSSVYAYLDKVFLKRFDAVVPVSRTVEGLVLETGLNKKKVRLIENGINIYRFIQEKRDTGLRSLLGIDPGSKVVGTVGRLAAEKGHKILLQSAGRVLDAYKDCFFVIVGDGKLRGELEEDARAAGIGERVIFTGARSDIPELLSIMDVFVLPSLTEGQPMALLEAMAAGKAVVASNVGDVKKILKDGLLGIVTPPADPGAVSEGILHYLNNPSAAGKAGAMARKEAVERYSSARMAGEYQLVYDAVRNRERLWLR